MRISDMAVAHRQGGFDANFVEPLSDRLTCPICHLAPREPRITECGHQFCLGCLRPLIRNAAVICPACRTDLKETEIYPNNMVKREILNLKIKCDKQEEGCEWIGKLRERDEHNQICGYIVVPCDNDCKEMVMRKDRKHHKENLCCKRIVICSYCGIQLEYQEVSVHFETCVKCPVDCHYGCGMQIPRRDMDVHSSREGNCPESPFKCDFAGAGCQFIGNRRQLEDHLQQSTVSHLSSVMRSLHTTKERLAASDERHTEELARKLADMEAASDKRYKKLAKKLADTEAVLTKRESELECVKAFLSLEFRSSQTLQQLMQDGLEKSLASAEFVRSVLTDKSQWSVESSGTFHYVWKIKANMKLLGRWCFTPFTMKFYTGHPGWHIKLCCQDLSDFRFGAPPSIMVYLLKGQHDDQLPQSHATLCITLIDQNQQADINIITVCPLPTGLRFIIDDDYLLARCQFSYDAIRRHRCPENDEILLKFWFKPHS